MSAHTSLAALENAHDGAIAAARNQIEQADAHLSYYRSQVTRVQESFHEHAIRQGISEHPWLRSGLQQLSDECEENVWQANRMIAELDEDLQTLISRHAQEREDFIERQRQAG